METVVEFSKTCRRKSLTPVPEAGAEIIDFAKAELRILAARRHSACLSVYTERFRVLKESCDLILHCFVQGLPFNSLSAEEKARQFLSAGLCLLKPTKESRGPDNLEILHTAYRLGEKLRTKLFGLASHNTSQNQLLEIERLCSDLSATLAPLFSVTRTFNLAHS